MTHENKNNPQEKHPSKISRRLLLGGAAAAVASGLVLSKNFSRNSGLDDTPYATPEPVTPELTTSGTEALSDSELLEQSVLGGDSLPTTGDVEALTSTTAETSEPTATRFGDYFNQSLDPEPTDGTGAPSMKRRGETASLTDGTGGEFTSRKNTAETKEQDETEAAVKTLEEQLEEVNADFDTMQAFADMNIRLYGNALAEYLCLMGVRLSLKEIYPELNDPLLVGSAYLAADVFESSNLFAEIKIENEEQLHDLPNGSILVYPRNTVSNYDFADGAHHGHIGIILGKDEEGNTLSGSDHKAYLQRDLDNMDFSPRVFVAIK